MVENIGKCEISREIGRGGRFIVHLYVLVVIGILAFKSCGDDMGKLYRV
jgi:hypothetical protein